MPRSRDHIISIQFKPEEYAELAAEAGTTPIGTFVHETVWSCPRLTGHVGSVLGSAVGAG